MSFAACLLGLASLLAYALLAPLALRSRLLSPIGLLFGCSLLVHLGASAAGASQIEPFHYWHAASVHWTGFALHLWFFGAFYKSMTLALVANLSLRGDGAASLDEAYERCFRASFAERVALLEGQGLVLRDPRGLTVTASGAALARRIRSAQRLFGIPGDGLYFAEGSDLGGAAEGAQPPDRAPDVREGPELQ